MKHMKVSLKLIISFMIIAALAIVVGVIGLVGMNSINMAVDDLYDHNVVSISAMGDIRSTLIDQRVTLRNYLLERNHPDKMSDNLKTMQALEKQIEEMFVKYENTITDMSIEDEYFNSKKLYQNDYATIKMDVYNASLKSLEEGYEVLYAPNNTIVINKMVVGFENIMRQNDDWAQKTVLSNFDLFMKMLVIEIVILAVTFVFALVWAFYISGLISKPLSVISSFMKKASDTGDIVLTREVSQNIAKYSQARDEIGQTIASSASFIEHVNIISNELKTISNGDLSSDIELLSENDTMGISLKNMVENLNEMFGEIQSSTNQVSTGAKQVADGAQTLAQGSTEQAASIQELSSSVSEISESTKTNAHTADKAAKLSNDIKHNAEKGSRQMDEMITAVKDINDASQSISKIIKTIDDIAFQTNILALNAAVEAARAGQHGKGFAVVAEEVRNLASKSAEAAKDTGDMIQNSMEKAELGSRMAGETAASLKDIVNGINESGQLIGEIAKASEEQSSGISQINVGVDQVAQVVQQNSATAEESAAASEEMSSQSETLQQLIGQFKLKNGNSPSRIIPGFKQNASKQAQRRLTMPPKEPDMSLSASTLSNDYGKY